MTEIQNENSRYKNKEDMNIVIVGHVDHGKSTIIGRLLADTDSLPKGKLEQVKERCRRNSKPFEYAFLLDALKDEQAQGITIDSARCFFKTQKREYIIIDAPGHIEFLKNMVTGAARAEAALLVIDAHEGIQENSKRHGYLLSMLGIKQIVVVVNKMDLIDYNEKIYNNIVSEYTKFLDEINIKPEAFIPVSGMLGDNISYLSENIKWYTGKTILELLDSFRNEKKDANQVFRMFVQDVYKFTRNGDNRRIVAGTIETGKIQIGDEVVFYPSGKKSVVKSIEGFNQKPTDSVSAGYAVGFTLKEQIYLKRGDLAVLAKEQNSEVTTRFSVNLFWLSKKPFIRNRSYDLKIGSMKVKVRIEKITRVIDASSLSNLEKSQIERHDVAECILKTEKPIAFDINGKIQNTSRFVIIDNFNIAGGGIINEGLEDGQTRIREKVILRNFNWEKSMISPENRAERYNQKAKLLIITGEYGAGRREIAKNLEKMLFNTGKFVYYLGVENLIYGVDSDMVCTDKDSCDEEKTRRFGEIANLMLDAGNILIATIVELKQKELDIIKTTVNPEDVNVIWIGEEITTDVKYDLHVNEFDNIEDVTSVIKTHLQDVGVIFRHFYMI